MNQSKSAIVKSQVMEKVQLIIGWAWVVLFGFTAVVMTFEKEVAAVDKVLVWIFALIGVPILMAGKKRKKMRLEFKRYVAQLSVDSSGRLDSMASAANTPADTVKKNLQYMIKKGFFTDAYIDEGNNCLVLPSMVQKAQQQSQTASTAETQTQAPTIACSCPNCGGANKIKKGTVAECDFCGSPLQG